MLMMMISSESLTHLELQQGAVQVWVGVQQVSQKVRVVVVLQQERVQVAISQGDWQALTGLLLDRRAAKAFP